MISDTDNGRQELEDFTISDQLIRKYPVREKIRNKRFSSDHWHLTYSNKNLILQ